MAGEKDTANLHLCIGLAMPAQTAVILSPAEMLDVQLCRRMIHYLRENARAGKTRLTNLPIIAGGVEQNTVEFEPCADFRFPVIDAHHVSFAHPILARSIFENGVHRWGPRIVTGVAYRLP